MVISKSKYGIFQLEHSELAGLRKLLVLSSGKSIMQNGRVPSTIQILITKMLGQRSGRFSMH
jgi:hypothetical protein